MSIPYELHLFKLGWYQDEKRNMKFALPRIWQELKDYVETVIFLLLIMLKDVTAKMRNPLYILTLLYL